MLDCISGGRLVAGFPTGLPADAVLSNGVVPIEQRERYREALALVTKAWSAKEVFAWNGKHYQLGMVNLWPRPIQQPHPPIWIPGAGISATAEYVVGLDHCFCHLSYYGAEERRGGERPLLGASCARKGRDDNPYRYSFLQLIGVAETDAEAEDASTARTPNISSTSCSTRRRTISRSPAASNTTAWCRRCAAQSARCDQSARAQGQGFLRARLHHRRQPEDRAREAARRRQAAAHRPPADAPAFRLDADRAVQAEHRPVRARSAAASRAACGTTSTRTAGGPSACRAKRPVAAAPAMAAAS